MTLIVYTRCTDGQVLVVDRKESDDEGVPSHVRKYYLPNNREYVLALAGNSVMIDMITSSLDSDQGVTGDTVVSAIRKAGAPLFSGNSGDVLSGILMAKAGGRFEHYRVAISNSTRTIIRDDPDIKCDGSGGAIAGYLAQKLLPSPLAWRDTLPLVAEVVDEVSAAMDGVGGVEKYGIDAFVFPDDGEMLDYRIRGKGVVAGITCALADRGRALSALSRVIGKSGAGGGEGGGRGGGMRRGRVPGAGAGAEIEYEIGGGEVSGARVRASDSSVVIEISAASRGVITAKLPRRLIDSRYRGTDDDFYVAVDGDEAEFREARRPDSRVLTVEFGRSCRQIEIVGTEARADSAGAGRGAAAPSGRARARGGGPRGPIRIRTDAGRYDYGSEIVIAVFNPHFKEGQEMQVEMVGPSGKVVHSQPVFPAEDSGGRYQHVVRIEGEEWTGGRYIVRCRSGNREASAAVMLSPHRIRLILDRGSYSWKGVVGITAVATARGRPLGGRGKAGGEIAVSLATGKGRLDGYRLVESRPGNGIFIGQVRLTGFVDQNTGAKGLDTRDSGATSGRGPFNGKMACGSDDLLTVSIASSRGILERSARAGWAMSAIRWRAGSYESPGPGTIQLYDPDIGSDLGRAGGVPVRVTSRTDSGGIAVNLFETGVGNGIYEGSVHFDPSGPSRKGVVHAPAGDVVTVHYAETTPPTPHDPRSRLPVTAAVPIKRAARVPRDAVVLRPRIAAGAGGGAGLRQGRGIAVCRIAGDDYVPAEVVARPGQTVTWVNEDAGSHTVTSGTPRDGPDGLFDSGLVASGSSFACRFGRKGRYSYFCILHPWQRGTVTII